MITLRDSGSEIRKRKDDNNNNNRKENNGGRKWRLLREGWSGGRRRRRRQPRTSHGLISPACHLTRVASFPFFLSASLTDRLSLDHPLVLRFSLSPPLPLPPLPLSPSPPYFLSSLLSLNRHGVTTVPFVRKLDRIRDAGRRERCIGEKSLTGGVVASSSPSAGIPLPNRTETTNADLVIRVIRVIRVIQSDTE